MECQPSLDRGRSSGTVIHMTTTLVLVILSIVWGVIAIPVALIIGRGIRIADEAAPRPVVVPDDVSSLTD